MSESLFNKPSYLSQSQYQVIQRVAYFVAMSEDTARYQQRLLEKTRHLPSFNFIRDPIVHADVIKKNTVNSSRPLLSEQLAEVHRLYTNFVVSYRHNKPYIQQTMQAASTAAGYGGQRYHVEEEENDNAVRGEAAAVNDAGSQQTAGLPTESFEPAIALERIPQQVTSAGRKRSRTPVDDDDE